MLFLLALLTGVYAMGCAGYRHGGQMKVKDLVKELLSQDQEADVIVVENDSRYSLGWMRLNNGQIAISSGCKLKENAI